MTRSLIPALFAASTIAISFAACSPKNPDAKATTLPTAAVIDTGATATPATNMPDDKTKTFVQKAALSDMFEIESAKQALARSKAKPIKDFAQMMIDDHSATTKELGPLAQAAGIMPPSALDDDHNGKLKDLAAVKDKDFDTKYLDQQTDAHNAALDLMKDYAQNGKDPAIQAFATKVSGKVEEHLQKAKSLDKNGADDTAKKS